jgi:hypothetical protein
MQVTKGEKKKKGNTPYHNGLGVGKAKKTLGNSREKVWQAMSLQEG